MKLVEYAKQCGLSTTVIRSIAIANGIKIRFGVLSPYQVERLDNLVNEYHEQAERQQATEWEREQGNHEG